MTHIASQGALLGCLILSGLALTTGSGLAQDAPPPAATPRCGGLVCDLGIIGGSPAAAARGEPDPTALPCNDFLCRAFGGGRNAQAAPPPAPVAATEPEKPAKATRRKRAAKVAAKTETKNAAETKAAAGSSEAR